MSTTYLMTLRPLEPYFFGNEKTFSFDPKKSPKNQYFIKSERMPLQTTLLGALRYMLMPVKHSSFSYTKEEREINAKVIGEKSFQIEMDEQSFGIIEELSPVFLTCGGKKYVRTPFDHNVSVKERYTPFEQYESVNIGNQEKMFTPVFNAKEGVADSYMNVETGELVQSDDIFFSVVRVGINMEATQNGFFKKQFSAMKSGWSFACYVTLTDDTHCKELLRNGTIAHLGQNKSTFHVQFKEERDNLPSTIAKWLRKDMYYCFGDTYVLSNVYQDCMFAVVELRDYRAYQTTMNEKIDRYVGGVKKGDTLYRLITAGSVFMVNNTEVIKHFQRANCEKVGFNSLIPKKEASDQ